jgi:hypothetical protein
LVQGRTVRFSTLAAALTDLLKQESLPALERRLRRYVAPDLLRSCPYSCVEARRLPDGKGRENLRVARPRRPSREETKTIPPS